MRRVKQLLAIIIFILGLTFVTSCEVSLIDISKVQGAYDLSGVEFNDATFTYDGQEHSIEISGQAPEGLVVKYTGNKQKEVGWHRVTATFSSNGTDVGSKSTYINIVKSSLVGVSFEGGTFVYDGTIPDIKIKGNLPAGVTVSYSGNLKADPGTYYVYATFKGPSGYDLPTMSCEVRILEASFNASDATFSSNTFFYDGNPHSLGVTGVPGFVKVTYTNNDKIDVGTYTVIAHFESSLCEVPEDMEATLIILPPSVLSNVKFKSTSVTYDGKPHSIEATNLPDGITVSYTKNSFTNAGSYEITASFTDTTNPNADLPNMIATLTIDKADYSSLDFDLKDDYIIYDGKNHTFELSNLPAGVSASYTYKKYHDNQSKYVIEEGNGNTFKDLGVYVVTALFTTTDSNYNTPKPITRRFEIMYGKIDVEFKADSCMYDGEAHGVTMEGTLPNGYTVSDFSETHVGAGVYTYHIWVSGPSDSNVYKEYVITLTIEKYRVNLADVTLDLNSFNFIRGKYSVGLTSELSNGVIVNYTWDDSNLSTSGIVTVALSFTMPDNDNYEQIDTMYLDIDTTKLNNKITFDPNGGTMQTTEMSVVDFAQTGGPIEPYMENYDFVSWAYVDSDGQESELTSSDISSLLGNVTLKATWIDERLNRPSYTELADGTLEITGIGDFRGTQLHIREAYDGKTVTSIGEAAFKNNSTLRCLFLPDTVKTLKKTCFYYMSNIEYLDVGSGVTTIEKSAIIGMTKLTDLIIDYDKITSMDDGNIYNLAIHETQIPKNFTSIPNMCYSLLKNVTSLEIPTTVTSIGDYVLCNIPLTKVTLPSGLSEIGIGSLSNLNVTSLVIPNSVTNIPVEAIKNNTNMTSLSLPSSLISIEEGALSRNTSLTTITLPSTLKTIGKNVLNNCDLSSLTIPSSVTSIGTDLFLNNTNMTSFVVESANTTYCTVNNVLLSKNKDTLYYYPAFITNESYTLPNETKNIAESAFYRNSKLTKITNGENVETIGECAFYNLKLTSFTFGANLKSIGKSAFYGTKLTSIDLSVVTAQSFELGESAFENNSEATVLKIPTGLTEIPKYAFRSCSKIESLDLKNVTIVGRSAFNCCSKLASITAGKLVKIMSYGFRSTSIQSAYIPNLEYIGIMAFGGYTSNTNVCKIELTIDHSKDINLLTFDSSYFEYESNQQISKYPEPSPAYVFKMKSSHGNISAKIYKYYYHNSDPNVDGWSTFHWDIEALCNDYNWRFGDFDIDTSETYYYFNLILRESPKLFTTSDMNKYRNFSNGNLGTGTSPTAGDIYFGIVSQ